VAGDLTVSKRAADAEGVVSRAQGPDCDYLRAVEGTLSEWASPADEEAYRDL
jgi:antitoxin PrlF